MGVRIMVEPLSKKDVKYVNCRNPECLKCSTHSTKVVEVGRVNEVVQEMKKVLRLQYTRDKLDEWFGGLQK